MSSHLYDQPKSQYWNIYRMTSLIVSGQAEMFLCAKIFIGVPSRQATVFPRLRSLVEMPAGAPMPSAASPTRASVSHWPDLRQTSRLMGVNESLP